MKALEEAIKDGSESLLSQDRLLLLFLLILTFLDAADVAVELSSGGGGGDVGEIRNAFVDSIDFFLLLLLLSLPALFVVVTSLSHVFPAAAST